MARLASVGVVFAVCVAFVCGRSARAAELNAPIPPDAKILWAVYEPAGHHAIGRNVSSAAKVAAVATLLDRLPLQNPEPGAVYNCPAQFGVINLSFYAAPTSSPVATALVPVGGCGDVEISVDGASQPARNGTFRLVGQIEALIRLDIGAGRPGATGRRGSAGTHPSAANRGAT